MTCCLHLSDSTFEDPRVCAREAFKAAWHHCVTWGQTVHSLRMRRVSARATSALLISSLVLTPFAYAPLPASVSTCIISCNVRHNDWHIRQIVSREREIEEKISSENLKTFNKFIKPTRLS
jgi:hypothetical protein